MVASIDVSAVVPNIVTGVISVPNKMSNSIISSSTSLAVHSKITVAEAPIEEPLLGLIACAGKGA